MRFLHPIRAERDKALTEFAMLLRSAWKEPRSGPPISRLQICILKNLKINKQEAARANESTPWTPRGCDYLARSGPPDLAPRYALIQSSCGPGGPLAAKKRTIQRKYMKLPCRSHPYDCASSWLLSLKSSVSAGDPAADLAVMPPSQQETTKGWRLPRAH